MGGGFQNFSSLFGQPAGIRALDPSLPLRERGGDSVLLGWPHFAGVATAFNVAASGVKVKLWPITERLYAAV